jgi:ERCC4-related helicase
MDLASLKPRVYQSAIVETAKSKNTLVVLPTGVGKTLIALLLAIDRLKKNIGSKVLMLAPTRPLVEQHVESFKKQLPELFAELAMFTGATPAQKRRELWDTAEIIFSTPQCVANDLKRGLYTLTEVSLLIIDEAHRCLKNYDYTYVSKQYKTQSKNQRILGLTASPGSDRDRVRQICAHLAIETVEVRTRDSADVKPYLQEREMEKHEVPFPKEFIEMKALLAQIYNAKIEQLKNRDLLFGPSNKIVLLKLQTRLAKEVSPGNFHAMIGMSLCAQAIKIAHAIELLETQTLAGVKEYLMGLQQQAEEKRSKGVQTIVNSPEFRAAYKLVTDAVANGIEHPKVEELKVLVEQEFKIKENAKIIIFTQFRETAKTILKKITEIPNARPKIFVGQAKKKSSTGNTGLSQKEQREVIEEFKTGAVNVLCATSIGEEGLDIPEVNAVYFYEPIPSEIRRIQRAGRTARLMPGKLAILITKNTRDESYHYAAIAREKKMHRTIEAVQKELKNQPKTLKDFPHGSAP